MKHFFIMFLCAVTGLVIGLLLSKAVVSPFLQDTETLMPKNGVIIETYR
jgi:hypothetical protein